MFTFNGVIELFQAPELFDSKEALLSLEQAKNLLLGPLGMKTLDPEDWAYDGYYDNSNDSTDIKLAHGWNYHQGPEWVWPIGYFLRARLYFASMSLSKKEIHEMYISTQAIIANHLIEASTNHWRGLPELTNKNGSYCKDSCRTQAWSGSAILEVSF